MFPAEHTMQHQIEHELWLKELGFLHEEIDIMKRHLSDVYYKGDSEDMMHLVETFNEKFTLQKKWLNKMRNELQHFEEPNDQDEIGETVKRSFSLQMQANRIVNEELKDSFLKLFS